MDEYNKYKNSQNHKKHNKRNKLSFYVSLAICITAVGLAVWSTFSSYSSFKENSKRINFQNSRIDNLENWKDELENGEIYSV